MKKHSTIQEIIIDRQYLLLSRYFSLRFNTYQLINHSVETSTIRAFRHNKDYITYTPSSIFRTWALKFLSQKHEELKANQSFELLHRMASDSLEKYWTSKDGGQLRPHQKFKLTDLLFKFIPRWNDLDEERQLWFFKHANVPLDSYSLSLLKQYSPNNLMIRKNSSMSFVKDTTHYKKLQEEIKELCKPFPCIIFDLIAWNDNHEKEGYKLKPHSKNDQE